MRLQLFMASALCLLNTATVCAATDKIPCDPVMVIRQIPGAAAPCTPNGKCEEPFPYGLILVLCASGDLKMVDSTQRVGKSYVQGRISLTNVDAIRSLVRKGFEEKRFESSNEMHVPKYLMQFKFVYSPTNSDVLTGSQTADESHSGPIGDILKLVRSMDIANRAVTQGKLLAPLYW